MLHLRHYCYFSSAYSRGAFLIEGPQSWRAQLQLWFCFLGHLLSNRIATGKNSACNCNCWLCSKCRASLDGETGDLKPIKWSSVEVSVEDDNKMKSSTKYPMPGKAAELQNRVLCLYWVTNWKKKPVSEILWYWKSISLWDVLARVSLNWEEFALAVLVRHYLERSKHQTLKGRHA